MARASAEAELKPGTNARKAIVDIHPMPMSEKLSALFLDPHSRPLLASDHKVVDFIDWFVEQAALLEDRLFINHDAQLAHQLVEFEFHNVLLYVSNFQCEFHIVL